MAGRRLKSADAITVKAVAKPNGRELTVEIAAEDRSLPIQSSNNASLIGRNELVLDIPPANLFGDHRVYEINQI